VYTETRPHPLVGPIRGAFWVKRAATCPHRGPIPHPRLLAHRNLKAWPLHPLRQQHLLPPTPLRPERPTPTIYRMLTRVRRHGPKNNKKRSWPRFAMRISHSKKIPLRRLLPFRRQDNVMYERRRDRIFSRARSMILTFHPWTIHLPRCCKAFLASVALASEKSPPSHSTAAPSSPLLLLNPKLDSKRFCPSFI